VGELTETWFSETDIAEGYDVFLRDCYIYGRMDQCYSWVMPWIEAAIPDLSHKTVLEIGCGNGTSTAPMAMKARHVHAFDITAAELDVARKRCAALGIRNVTIFHRDTSWINAYAKDPHSICDGVDVIYAYALLEHLTPLERITFLQAAWRHLPLGGHLIIVECPNRLHWLDWHSSQMPFADTLPSEIAFLYNGISKRSNIWSDIKAKDVDQVAACNRERLYRWGRGVSYHEFVLALGYDSFEVTAGPFSPCAIGRHDFYGPHGVEWEACLKKILQSLDPQIAPEFAAPSLDLILTRTR
jgi:SAM-dependent methyltransferase